MTGPSASAEVRTGGVLRSALSIGGRIAAELGPVVAELGPVGDVVAAAFIILDMIDGQWKAAAWAAGAVAAGLTSAGIAASIMGVSSLAGPVGLFIGAAVGVLFLILPGIFQPQHKPPSNNATEIIQWAFFGDATHTGNEKCNQNLQDKGQAPNCTITYGPGIISSMFDWNTYDAAIFLINFNEGHAMSIPDSKSSQSHELILQFLQSCVPAPASLYSLPL